MATDRIATDTLGEEATRPTLDPFAREQEQRAGRRLMRRLVLGILGLTVLVHGIALAYVLNVRPELVREDYYEAGEQHEGDLEARRLGHDLGLALELIPEGGLAGADVLALRASAPSGRVDGAAEAVVRLYRPGRQALDREVTLLPVEEESVEAGALAWRAETALLAPGRWRARATLLTTRGERAAIDHSFEVERP